MGKWRKVPLGSVATIARDAVDPASIDTNTPYVGLENVERGGAIIGVTTTAEAGVSSLKYRFTSRQVLYGKLRPYLAKVARPQFDGVCSTDILPINPSDQLDRDYLAHFLLHPETVALASARATGANLPRLSPKELAAIEIPLPSLTEQRRIAHMLDWAAALRVKRQDALAQLEELALSIFIEMFGDPRTNPKGWPIGRIGDLLESATYGTSEKASNTIGFPVLRMNNITATGRLDLTDLKYLATAPSERYLVRQGDILFNRTNSAELVGKTAIYRLDRPMAYAGYLIRLRVNSHNDAEYVSAFLNSRYGKRVLRGMCKSIIGMANINARELQSIEIPIPPTQLQRAFAQKVGAIERVRTSLERSSIELDELFDSLQTRAFRGEL